MPLYDGMSSIGMMNEKHPTVFDFGYAFTKLGFVGETGPRAIIRSQVKCRKTGKLVPVFKYETEEELCHHIIDFIYVLYIKYLLVNPKERRVVIVENILSSSIVKDVLASVFFRHYEVLSVLFVPAHLVCLMTLGISTGLVLDIGYNEATLIPVYEGVPVLNAWQALPCGSKSIHKVLEELLLDRAVCNITDKKDQRLSSVMDSLPERILEDIKVRCCFVSSFERKERLYQNKYDRANEPPPPPPCVRYPLSGNCILNIPGTVREMASEILFETDEDKLSIPHMFVNALMKCSIDMRSQLAQNIVIIGGTSAMLGLKHRILLEIKSLFNIPPLSDKKNISFKIHTVPAKANYTAWLGGAIMGATEAITIRSLTQEAYLKVGSVPDWSSLAFNVKQETYRQEA